MSANSSVLPLDSACFRSTMGIAVFSTFSIVSLPLLPLSFLVLCLGYRGRGRGSTSDPLVYHSVVMQLIALVGFACYFCGGYVGFHDVLSAGLNIWSTTALGQATCHVITCVERYLAVVHPTTYLSLGQASGARIINVSIGCVWLLSFAWLAVCYLASPPTYLILYSCNMVLILVVISFCSVCVLRALKRPGPGGAGGNENKERADQSKLRAFHNMAAIMAVLLMRFGWNLMSLFISNAKLLGPSNYCVVVLSAFWVDLPSSLVLPLLFLHRRGKLCCCKQNPKSG